jgi:aspartate ammonia-lyase
MRRIIMNIELMINSKKKTFKLPSFIPGRLIRKATAFTNMDLTRISENDLDEMVQYVVEVYGNQFTLDDFYDGIDARIMLNVIGEVINFIVNGTIEAAGGSKDPNK